MQDIHIKRYRKEPKTAAELRPDVKPGLQEAFDIITEWAEERGKEAFGGEFKMTFPTLMGEVEPEDRSWVLKVYDDGPRLFIRVQYEDLDGSIKHGYVNVRQIPEDLTVQEVAESIFGDPCDHEGKPLEVTGAENSGGREAGPIYHVATKC